MKKVSEFFSIISGVFAVIPGLAVLVSNVGVPPNSSKVLFGGIIESLGALTLMILWLNKDWIKATKISSINKWASVSIFVFIICLFSYIFLYNYLVVEVANTQSVFFPLWASGELKSGVFRFGSRDELISQWGRDDVYKVIQSSCKTSLLITTLIMLFIYQLTFVALTFAFGLLGIKLSNEKNL